MRVVRERYLLLRVFLRIRSRFLANFMMFFWVFFGIRDIRDLLHVVNVAGDSFLNCSCESDESRGGVSGNGRKCGSERMPAELSVPHWFPPRRRGERSVKNNHRQQQRVSAATNLPPDWFSREPNKDVTHTWRLTPRSLWVNQRSRITEVKELIRTDVSPEPPPGFLTWLGFGHFQIENKLTWHSSLWKSNHHFFN